MEKAVPYLKVVYAITKLAASTQGLTLPDFYLPESASQELIHQVDANIDTAELVSECQVGIRDAMKAMTKQGIYRDVAKAVYLKEEGKDAEPPSTWRPTRCGLKLTTCIAQGTPIVMLARYPFPS